MAATAGKEATLDDYREEIDKIDDKIIKLMAQRVKVVEQVGQLKGKTRSRRSIIRPGREATMIRRVTERAKGPAVLKAAMAYMWRLIIASATNIEEKTHISSYATHDNTECFWLAREYFGPFTPVTQRPTSVEVIKDVIEEKASIGVLPLWDEKSPMAWWARLADEKAPPFIFARIPFVQLAPSQKSPLVAIGYVEPEPTEDDNSLWVIRTEETFPVNMTQRFLEEAGLPHELQGECRVLGNPTMWYYLMKIEGFSPATDKRVKSFLQKANEYNPRSTPITAHYLGSYAKPMLFNL